MRLGLVMEGDFEPPAAESASSESLVEVGKGSVCPPLCRHRRTGGQSGHGWAFLGTLVQLMNLLSWQEAEAAAWTRAEQSREASLVHWACDFPVGVPARQQCNSNNLSLCVSCPGPAWQSRKHPPAKVFKPQRVFCGYWFPV